VKQALERRTRDIYVLEEDCIGSRSREYITKELGISSEEFAWDAETSVFDLKKTAMSTSVNDFHLSGNLHR
jgi:hypothetical protein